MHIHGVVPNVQGANFYGVSNGERAATQRAAEVRKRLLKAGQAGSDEASPAETQLIGQWMDSRHSHVLSGEQERDAEAGRDPDFG